MLQSFTRNYYDNSTEAGFQFTFHCDCCNDGYKSTFIESSSYKKKKATSFFGKTAGLAGSIFGGKSATAGNTAERGSDILSERFEGMPPEWHKEHEQAFERSQNESKQHFHRCPGDTKYVCDQCWNEDAGLCTDCAPRQDVYIAQAHAQAMKRNIDEKAATATVWQGNIESKTTICRSCGKPAGTGKFCNSCGASLDLAACPNCGAKNAQSVTFCNNCGTNLRQAAPAAPAAQAPPSSRCPCGFENEPGTKFCGSCGNRL